MPTREQQCGDDGGGSNGEKDNSEVVMSKVARATATADTVPERVRRGEPMRERVGQ